MADERRGCFILTHGVYKERVVKWPNDYRIGRLDLGKLKIWTNIEARVTAE